MPLLNRQLALPVVDHTRGGTPSIGRTNCLLAEAVEQIEKGRESLGRRAADAIAHSYTELIHVVSPPTRRRHPDDPNAKTTDATLGRAAAATLTAAPASWLKRWGRAWRRSCLLQLLRLKLGSQSTRELRITIYLTSTSR